MKENAHSQAQYKMDWLIEGLNSSLKETRPEDRKVVFMERGLSSRDQLHWCQNKSHFKKKKKKNSHAHHKCSSGILQCTGFEASCFYWVQMSRTRTKWSWVEVACWWQNNLVKEQKWRLMDSMKTDRQMQDAEADVTGETERRMTNGQKKRNVISCLMDSIVDNRQEVDLFEESARKWTKSRLSAAERLTITCRASSSFISSRITWSYQSRRTSHPNAMHGRCLSRI